MAYTASLLNARLARSMEVTRGGDCGLSQDGLLGPPTPGGAGNVRTVAVMNEKGGSGKTTTTISLAAVLAERGFRVLVVDLDPQASASLWLGRGREPGLYRAIAEKRDLEPFVRATAVAGLDIIAGSRELAAVDDFRGRIGIRDRFPELLTSESRRESGKYPHPRRQPSQS